MKRRGFLQSLVAAAAGIGVLSSAKAAPVAVPPPPPKKKRRSRAKHRDPQVAAVMAMIEESGQVIDVQSSHCPGMPSTVTVTYAYRPGVTADPSSPMNQLAKSETLGRSIRSVSVDTEFNSLTMPDIGFGPQRIVETLSPRHIVTVEWI